MKPIKICITFSSGGHMMQALQLKEFFERFDHFFVVKKTPMTKGFETPSKKYYTFTYENLFNVGHKYYRFFSIFFFCFSFLINFIVSIYYFFKEKPDVIVSTGTSCTIPICYIGKLFKRKVIWIESFAKINSPSVSGKLAYPIADLFIVQWEDMISHYPKAVYGGWIY